MRTKLWMILLAGVIVSAAAIAKPTGSTIFSFGAGPEYGAHPKAGLIADSAGNLYGTASSGGPAKLGAVYELAPTGNGWEQTILYNFCSVKHCRDGSIPETPLIFDGKGNLYGTTLYGGNNSCYASGGGCGVVFELSPSNGGWTESVIYSFEPVGGAYVTPSGLTFDKAGNLYGTTQAGDYGNVFELSPTNSGWQETTIYAFCPSQAFCPDGGEPNGGVIVDAQGNLYGTTAFGGTGPGGVGGIVYELSHASGAWTENVLYNFCSSANCTDGEAPLAAPTPDGRGNLFGTTIYGGTGDPNQCESETGCGTVFELMPSQSGDEWAETVIHSFTGADGDGAFPDTAVIFDPKGDLYGTTDSFGANGTVFQMVSDNGAWTERYWTFMAPPNHYPNGLLLERGSIYGTTRFGGSHQTGAVFQIIP